MRKLHGSGVEFRLQIRRDRLRASQQETRKPALKPLVTEGDMLTKDQLIREYRNSGASWPALVVVYGLLLGTMVLSASAMI